MLRLKPRPTNFVPIAVEALFAVTYLSDIIPSTRKERSRQGAARDLRLLFACVQHGRTGVHFLFLKNAARGVTI